MPKKPGEDIVRLVEPCDGEPHPDKVDAAIEDMRDQRDAAIERADTAELAVKARDAEIMALRSILKQFEDGGMSGRELREAKADERAWFERECAMRFRAAYLTHGDGDFSELEEARKLADHFWGTK